MNMGPRALRSGSMGFGRGHMGGVGMPVDKPKDFRRSLFRLLRYFGPRRLQLLAAIVAAAIGTIFNILGPKILGLATTRLFADMLARIKGTPGATVDFAYIRTILFVLVGLYLFSALFQYLQQYIMASVAQNTVYAMRRQLEEKFERLPLGFFDAHTHGEVLSRAVNDMDNVSSALQQSLTQLISSLVMIIGVVVMMLTISPILSLVVVLTLPLSIGVTMLTAKWSQTYFAEQQTVLGELNGHVEETYTGHVVVKAFGREQASIAQFEALNKQLYDAGWKAQFVSGIIQPLMMSIGNIGYVFVSVIGGIMVTRQLIAIGDVQAFIQYARQFTQPISQLAGLANSIQLMMASAERVFELLDEQEEAPEAADAKTIDLPQGEVQFQHVTFSYKKDQPLIQDMNIDVLPGQTVAIVGPTGAGKTTLVNLLMRFYDVDGGKITIDGVDITQMKRGSLRRMFGMVLQDTWLFTGTIRQNIAYGREGADEQAIVEAAKAAQADHFIRTLPRGYDTTITQEAANLSQGQKQLLTIARAILADPAILILDEATSSVDTRTEILIQKAMSTLMQGRTNFVIAHRLSTIRDADVILVMDHGRVIEKGAHLELLEKGGFYATLYQSQFSGRAVAVATV